MGPPAHPGTAASALLLRFRRRCIVVLAWIAIIAATACSITVEAAGKPPPRRSAMPYLDKCRDIRIEHYKQRSENIIQFRLLLSPNREFDPVNGFTFDVLISAQYSGLAEQPIMDKYLNVREEGEGDTWKAFEGYVQLIDSSRGSKNQYEQIDKDHIVFWSTKTFRDDFAQRLMLTFRQFAKLVHVADNYERGTRRGFNKGLYCRGH